MARSNGGSSRSVAERAKLLSLDERIDPAHTALLVIDVQNDFCHPDGTTGRLGGDLTAMNPMTERIREVLAEARRLGLVTIFARANEDARYLTEPMAETYLRRELTEGLVRKGTWGADWFAGIEPNDAPNEIAFTKHRFSAFADTPLDLYLRSNGIRTVVFTGVVTSGCVDCSVRDGYSLGYHCVVPADCVADSSVDRHEASLRKLAQAFAAVVDSSAVIEIWRRKNARVNPVDEGSKQGAVPGDLQESVSASHTALLLVGDCRGGATAAERNIKLLLDSARAADVLVVHAAPSAHPLALSATMLRQRNADQPHGPADVGVDSSPSLADDGDEIVTAHRRSAFAGTRLDSLLRANGIRTVVVAGEGLTTTVESTVREASDRDLNVVLAQDAVVGVATAEDAALRTIAASFGQLAPASRIASVWGVDRGDGKIT